MGLGSLPVKTSGSRRSEPTQCKDAAPPEKNSKDTEEEKACRRRWAKKDRPELQEWGGRGRESREGAQLERRPGQRPEMSLRRSEGVG